MPDVRSEKFRHFSVEPLRSARGRPIAGHGPVPGAQARTSRTTILSRPPPASPSAAPSRPGPSGPTAPRPAPPARRRNAPRAACRHAAASPGHPRARREPVPAQQRVDPDHAPRRQVQPLHLARQIAGSPRSSPSVIRSTTAPCAMTRRDQSRLNACRQAPIRVPPCQSCASAPGGGQRGIHVALAQVAGDVGQPRAEGEGMHLRPALSGPAGWRPRGRNAAPSANTAPSSPKCRTAPPAPASASPGGAGRWRRSRRRCAALARSVRRQSGRRPWLSGFIRRVGSGAPAAPAAPACAFAWRPRPPLICSKSSVRSRSSAEAVAVASISIRVSSSSPASLSGDRGHLGIGPAAPRRRVWRPRRRVLLLHAAHGGQQKRHHVLHVARVAPEQAESLPGRPPVPRGG
jgi:hypothetical protein